MLIPRLGLSGCIQTRVVIPSFSKKSRMRKCLWRLSAGEAQLKQRLHSYEVLSDPQKRSIYDARGEAGLSESGGMGGMDPQVRLVADSPRCSLLMRVAIRIYSVNYSAEEGSLAEEDTLRAHARRRTSCTTSLYPSKTYTRARSPSSHSRATSSASSVRVVAARKVQRRSATSVTDAVFASSYVKWVR